jgi:hypothetical protein
MPFDSSASALGRVRWIMPGEFTALLDLHFLIKAHGIVGTLR